MADRIIFKQKIPVILLCDLSRVKSAFSALVFKKLERNWQVSVNRDLLIGHL